MSAVTTPHEYATRVHGYGANVTAVGSEHKKPLHLWQHLHEQPQCETDVHALPWKQATRTGTINGIGGFRSFDIDGCTDVTVVITILRALGLPEDYIWVEVSSSGHGFHIWVICKDDLPPGAIPAKSDEPGVYVGLSKDGAFDRLELRWSRCQTIISSSDGSERWLHSRPEDAPATVSVDDVLNAFYAVASPKEQAHPPETPSHRGATHPDDRQDLEDIRARFDLVAYARMKWDDVQPDGDEYRVMGHQGLLINPGKGAWYRFGDEQGGDCFDLVGFAIYGEQWNRTIRTQFRAALREAAAFVGVDLPEYRRAESREPTPLRPEHVDPETGEIDPVRATTDYGNAERLVDHHGDDLRFCHPFGKWLAWDGNCWQIDTTAEVMRRAKQAARRIYQEAADASDPAHAKELAKHAIRSEGDARLRAMIGLAESEPGIPILPEHLDIDPWLLNVENGTINLKTGNLHPHDRADLITKVAPVTFDPTATCPTFDGFLARILPSESLRKFMQRVVGYALTGDTREDAIFINYGDGNNGKSTLVETVQALMGNYAMQTPVETLLVKRGEGIPNDVARLRGARFVAAAEGDEGRRLAEGLIKQLTGGDKVTARFLHGEFFEFPPTFKISLSTNHKPIIRGTDEGIWRRIRLVPFTVTIPKEERDADLPTTLRAELAGILNWAVAGCLAWQQDGLGMPEEIEQAVKSYREEMSPLQEFVEDRCFIKPDLWQPSADLWDAYQRWSTQAEGRRSVPKKDFAAHLRAFGCLPDKVRRVAGKNVRGWEGIGLLAPDGAPPPAQKPLETDDSLAAPEDSATAATDVTAFPAYFSRDFSHEELPGNAVAAVAAVALSSDGGRDRVIPPDLPPMARLELEAWARDIASGWGCAPNDLVRARAAAAALLALNIPEDASAEMVAALIIAALKDRPR